MRDKKRHTAVAVKEDEMKVLATSLRLAAVLKRGFFEARQCQITIK